MPVCNAPLPRLSSLSPSNESPMKLTHRLIRAYALYTLGFFLFIYVMARIERVTGPGMWIGYVFLFVPIAVYAVIGLLSRTSDLVEYYVAGRRGPAGFDGTAARGGWVSGGVL